MTKSKKIEKIDVGSQIYFEPEDVKELREKALHVIFNEKFIDFLKKINLSPMELEKREKIRLELDTVLVENLRKPDKTISNDSCIYFCAEELTTLLMTRKKYIDIKKFSGEYKKK